MFIPIGDAPNPRFTPWLNYVLIAVNVAVFVLLWPMAFQRADPGDARLHRYLEILLQEQRIAAPELRQAAAQLTVYDLFVFEHGFRPGSPTLGDAVSAMFLHGGLAHLLGNMLFLWIFGDNLEHRLGRFGYLLFYLLTGFVATAGDGAIRWGSELPSVGASGAISGVLGAYFLWFPFNRVRVWVFLFPFFADVIELPARFVLGMYIVVQNLLPLLLTGGKGGGVSYGAHVGGFVAGMIGAWLLNASFARPEPALRAHRTPRGKASEQRSELRAEFLDAVDGGRLADAASLLFESPRRVVATQLLAADKLRLVAELMRAGHGHAALSACHSVLRDHPGEPEATRAHLFSARLLMGPLGQPTAAFQHLRTVLATSTSPGDVAEARTLLAELAAGSASFPRRLQ